MRSIGLMILGFVAGLSSAALGIGGGAVMVPSLTVFFAFDIKKAIGTSLAFIGPCALVGITTHYIRKPENIQFICALGIIAGSLIGARFGASLAKILKREILSRIFALLLVFVGLKYIHVIRIPETAAFALSVQFPLLVVLGLIAGSGSALLGIGGGVIMVPALNLFFGLHIHEAMATSLTVILPTSIAGAFFHRKFKHIEPSSLLFLIPTALPGAVCGALLANSLPEDQLKIVFGIFMLVISVKMWIRKEKGKSEADS